MTSETFPAQTSKPAVVKTTGFLVLLAILSALGQFASNVYLPSLPAVTEQLGISGSVAALTYTIYLGAFAFAQLVYGPVADRFGRRPLLLLGAILFVLGSGMCMLAGDVSWLLTGRVIQAIGAAAGVVMARAMVRDVFSGPELAKALALMTIVFALAPGLSPLLGGVLQDTLGWRSVFAAAAIAGVLVLIAATVYAPETLAKKSDAISLSGTAKSYRAILADTEFFRFALATAFIIGAMSAFFVGSPIVFIDLLGVSATEYGLYPPLAITGFIIGSVATRKLAGRLAVYDLAKVGVSISLMGAILMVVFPLFGIEHKHAINVSIVVFVSGMGVFMPTAVAIALERFPERAGTAAAMLGFLQMGIGAAASAGVGLLANAQPFLAFPIIMVVSALSAFALVATPNSDSSGDDIMSSS
ncbi:multidrug effflux MFS transporter [Erythrobacter crassostreae]|uniref:Bcr/CflA family efflux transporter n=1 Tax=Erythrobacter crassostreae TaxID=2828328 RepID=A0A9X1F3P8_9SPHN|nr:multidrug effflux MFS transporter [Erythrobacter crassostrea]MBV7259401.1 multidrug effflux MFS transporter [Erythrobacter crassostrea]